MTVAIVGTQPAGSDSTPINCRVCADERSVDSALSDFMNAVQARFGIQAAETYFNLLYGPKHRVHSGLTT